MEKVTSERVAKLEGRIESLERQMDRLTMGSPSQQIHASEIILAKLTPKQHVSLQMLMKGKSNAEIAKRLGVSENTAKVHVRGIAKKYGVSTRSQIVMCAFTEIEAVTSDQYKAMAGGLPKNWAEEYLGGSLRSDPNRKLYRE